MQGRSIRSLLDVLRELISEVLIKFDEHGMQISCLNNTKACFIDVRLAAGRFDEYVCEHPLHLGLHTSHVHKLLKSTGGNDTVALSVDAEADQLLCIRIANSETNTLVESQLNSLDIDAIDIEHPNMEYACRAVMLSSQLKDICREKQNISEQLTISATSDRQLCFHASGTVASQTTIVGETVNGMCMQTVPSTTVSSTFSLKYLTLLTKAHSMSKMVAISLDQTRPLTLSYSVGDLGDLSLVLAANTPDSDL